MRKLSKLAVLPPADQNYVINLCSKYPYEHVVTILVKTRPEGGLDLKTSRSALCRFAATFHPEPDRLAHEVKRLMPLLEATSVDPDILPSAIRTLLEQHITAQLAADAPFETVERPFRFLFKLHREQRAKAASLGRPPCTPLHKFSPKTPRDSTFPAFPAAENFSELSPET